MASTTDKGIIGYGTRVRVSDDGGTTWFTLGGLGNVTPPNASTDQVDVTTMDSPDRTREFIPGLTDLGDMTLSLNYVPGNGTDEYVVAWRVAGDNRMVEITYPTSVVDTFSAFPTGYSVTLATADKCTADLKLKVAGAVTRS